VDPPYAVPVIVGIGFAAIVAGMNAPRWARLGILDHH
jgi:hypothetical protein